MPGAHTGTEIMPVPTSQVGKKKPYNLEPRVVSRRSCFNNEESLPSTEHCWFHLRKLKSKTVKGSNCFKFLHCNPEQSQEYRIFFNPASHKVKFTMSYIQSNILTKHAKKEGRKTGPIGRRKGNQLKCPELTKILEVSDRNIRTVL